MSVDEFEREEKEIADSRAFLSQYIDYQKRILEDFQKKGSGIRGKQRGGNVFFHEPKKLLKKLEIIVGEIVSGNTSIQMRNMGVAILDTLLRTSIINKPQHERLYRNYFKM